MGLYLAYTPRTNSLRVPFRGSNATMRKLDVASPVCRSRKRSPRLSGSRVGQAMPLSSLATSRGNTISNSLPSGRMRAKPVPISMKSVPSDAQARPPPLVLSLRTVRVSPPVTGTIFTAKGDTVTKAISRPSGEKAGRWPHRSPGWGRPRVDRAAAATTAVGHCPGRGRQMICHPVTRRSASQPVPPVAGPPASPARGARCEGPSCWFLPIRRMLLPQSPRGSVRRSGLQLHHVTARRCRVARSLPER